MKRAIIIDDEQIGVSGLSLMIERHCPEIKVVATATDAEQGINIIEAYRPEIVFLDINMPKTDGFELLERLSFRDFKLVFTTAHEEYALRAIKNKAHDYLLKPIDSDELKACVAQVVSPQEGAVMPVRTHKIIELSVKDGVIFIKTRDLVRLEASGSYTMFYLENNVRHVASKNLKECEQLLDRGLFFRCHPSHIVNLAKVTKLVSADGLFAIMSDGSKAVVARKQKELMLERLKMI